MELLTTVLAVILLVCGVGALLNGALLWGIILMVAGLFLGGAGRAGGRW